MSLLPSTINATYRSSLKESPRSLSLILIQHFRKRRGRSLWLLILEFLAPQSLFLESLRIRIQAQKYLSVAERILLLHTSPLCLAFSLLGTDNGLDFSAVDQTRDIRISDHVRGQQEIFLERAGCGGAAVDGIERCERRGSPDDEAAEMSTWCEL